MNHTYTYEIAQLTIQVITPFPVIDDPSYALYRTYDKEASYTCIFMPDTHIPDYENYPLRYQDVMHQIYETPDGYLHFFSPPGCPYICWNKVLPFSGETTCIYHYQPELESYFHNSKGCFNAISLERILCKDNRFIFHCCYINTTYGSILFTAPSGGGKTTQGKLWEESGKGKIINGDRAVLMMQNTQCIAYGLPLAGSSNIFLNETHPVKAIIIVHKATHNTLERVTGMKAFYAIYEQLLTHVWDTTFQYKVMDMAQQLVENTPVYQLNCTISQDAVNIVEKALASQYD